jgi:hypothetical protein
MTRGEEQQQHESAQHDRHGYGLTMPEFKRAVERAMDDDFMRDREYARRAKRRGD